MGWLVGWSYRKSLIVTENSGLTLIDHQVGLLYLQGNDPEESNYIDFSLFQLDGADLRITKADGETDLHYWVKVWDPISKIVELYFKADVLVAFSNTYYYLYGGNSGASNASSYANTMTKYPNDDPNLVALYHLDEGAGNQAIDSSGNGQDSYSNNCVYRGQDSGGWKGDETYTFPGDSLYFDDGNPSSDLIKIAHDDIWNALASAGTISLIFNNTFQSTSPQNLDILISKSVLANVQLENKAFEIRKSRNNNKIQVIFGNGSSYMVAESVTALAVNTWYHIVVTWDGINVYIYINSVLDSTTSMTITPYTNTSDIGISDSSGSGHTEQTGINYGYLDEVVVTNDLWGQLEVDAAYSRKKFASTQPTWTFSVLTYGHDIDLDQPVVNELVEFSHDSNFNVFTSNPNESLKGNYDHDSDLDQISLLGEYSHDSNFNVFTSNPNESLKGNYDHDSDLDEIGLFGKYEHDSNINFFTSNPNESLLGPYDHDSDILSIPSAEDLEGLFDHDTDYDEFIYFPIESDIIIQVNSKFANEFTVSSKFSNSIEINSKITNNIKIDSEII